MNPKKTKMCIETTETNRFVLNELKKLRKLNTFGSMVSYAERVHGLSLKISKEPKNVLMLLIQETESPSQSINKHNKIYESVR